MLWVRVTYPIGRDFGIVSSDRRYEKVVSKDIRGRDSKKRRTLLWQARVSRRKIKGHVGGPLRRVGRRGIQAS